MRVVMLAFGTRGDVQPLVALGLGLQAAGYQVRIVTHPAYAALAGQRGLDVFAIAEDPQETAPTTASTRRRLYDNPVSYFRGIRETAARVMRRRAADCWQACRDADAIIASPLASLIGYHLSEKLHVPLVRAYQYPAIPTRAYPVLFLQGGPSLGSHINRGTHLLSWQLAWSLFRAQANAVRRDVLSLPPLPRRDPYRTIEPERATVLCGYSETIVPRPADWPSSVHVTGYWFLARPANWRPPSALLDFLAAGPPPVAVNFGSITNHDRNEAFNVVTAALVETGQRGVLVGEHLSPMQSEHIVTCADVPFDWLFPRAAAVVHHGGSGTTAEALRAGIPSVIVPILADQPFWGRRMHALGAGPAPIRRRQLTLERAAAAIRQAVSDQAMRCRAAELGCRIRGEDGIARAVESLDAVLRRR